VASPLFFTATARTLFWKAFFFMEVLVKIGRYAGELRDLRPDCAREMIADGRAEDPRLIPGPDSDCAPAYSALQIDPTSPAARKRRR
jgi:hypothetical protein